MRDKMLFWVSAAMIVLMSVLFGFSGFKTAVIIFILFIYPANLLLRLFGLNEAERLPLSILLGLSLFPLLTFYLYMVYPSLKQAYCVVAVAAYTTALFRKNKK